MHSLQTVNCKLYPILSSCTPLTRKTKQGIFLYLGLPICPRFHAMLPKLKDSIWDTVSGRTRLYHPKLSISKKHNTSIRWEAGRLGGPLSLIFTAGVCALHNERIRFVQPTGNEKLCNCRHTFLLSFEDALLMPLLFCYRTT